MLLSILVLHNYNPFIEYRHKLQEVIQIYISSYEEPGLLSCLCVYIGQYNLLLESIIMPSSTVEGPYPLPPLPSPLSRGPPSLQTVVHLHSPEAWLFSWTPLEPTGGERLQRQLAFCPAICMTASSMQTEHKQPDPTGLLEWGGGGCVGGGGGGVNGNGTYGHFNNPYYSPCKPSA